MNEGRDEISITVVNASEVYTISTYLHEYRNLMALLTNSIYLENFGECGGQGRCATCIVKVVNLRVNANIMERKEAATLSKEGLDGNGTRLSCQLLVNKDLAGALIEISGQGY
jgi:2Fe-2S ferredoxin